MSFVLLALLALPAAAAPLTQPLQRDGGLPGDAPGDAPNARLLEGRGNYTGTLVPLDDVADAYALAVPAETSLHVLLRAPLSAELRLVDPDGALVAIGTGTPPALRLLTDAPGRWVVVVVGGAAATYTLDVRLRETRQDDGGTGRDAGFRAASALELPLERTAQGNLTIALADCADLWSRQVTREERVTVRFAWDPTYATPALHTDLPGATRVESSRQGNTLNVTATATGNALWTWGLRLPDYAPGCLGATSYRLQGAVAHDPLAADGPASAASPSAPPEVWTVQPAVRRPGLEVEVWGANLTGATFRVGATAATVRYAAPDGSHARILVPVVAPATYDVSASRDGAVASKPNALLVPQATDLAVTELRVLDPHPGPIGPLYADAALQKRRLVVEVRNHGPEWAEPYVLSVEAAADAPPGAPTLWRHVATIRRDAPLSPGTTETHFITLDTRGFVGSFQVRAAAAQTGFVKHVPESTYESAPANNLRVLRDFAFVNPGVGAAPPATIP